MERRNFLKGLLISASAAASTALVKLATPQEAAALVPQRPIFLGQPEVPEMPPYDLGGYAYMKDNAGQFKPIGIVTEFRMNAHVDEILTWDGQVKVIPGLREADLRFQGPFAR